MRVRVILLRDPRAVKRALRACRDLVDARKRVKPKEFWQAGTYAAHPRWVNCYLVVILPAPGRDALALACRAAGVLERRKAAVLDWCAGKRGRGRAALLFVKPKGADEKTGKEKRIYIDRSDILALAALAGANTRKRGR